MRNLLFAVAALAATGGPAMAEIKPQNGWLTLSAPTTRDHIVFDGAVWRCKSDVCRSPQVKSLPPLRSCKRLAFLEAHLTGREFLQGKFRVADAYLFVMLTWARHLALDFGPYPALTAYRDRLQTRPSVARALGEEFTLFKAAA